MAELSISGYLKRYGWDYEVKDEKTLLSGFTVDQEHSYPVTITQSGGFVSMAVGFVLDADILGQRPELASLMLRLNATWPLAKLGLVEERTLLVTVDLPDRELSYAAFETGLDVLCETAQAFAEEFQSIIRED